MNNKRGVDVRVESMCRLLSAGVVARELLALSIVMAAAAAAAAKPHLLYTFEYYTDVCLCVYHSPCYSFFFCSDFGHPHDGHPAVHLHLNVIPYRGGGGGRERERAAHWHWHSHTFPAARSSQLPS